MVICNVNTEISIHAAREGGDDAVRGVLEYISKFQSTPPVKAATGVRQMFLLVSSISIHAAREGGDRAGQQRRTKAQHFNPRRP